MVRLGMDRLRFGSFTKSDIPRKDHEEVQGMRPIDGNDSVGCALVQRCVIVQKDEKGYGLTVSGDNPVFVQSVKEDGAAARSGVQQGDRIIKVNGTLVTQSNHQEVVRLIKSGSHVALTLLGPPCGQNNRPLIHPGLGLGSNYQSPQAHLPLTPKMSSPSERITGPKPVDPEQQQQCINTNYITIKKMLEQEKSNLEKLRCDFNKTPSDKVQADMQNAKKRIKILERQLNSLKESHLEAWQRTPRSPPSLRHGLGDSDNYRSVSFHGSVHHHEPHQGRALKHQISAPVLPKDRPPSTHPGPLSPKEGDVTLLPCTSPSTPTVPARANKGEGKLAQLQKGLSFSASFENVSKPSSPKTTSWPHHGVPSHSRQSSSPDNFLCKIESPDVSEEQQPGTSEGAFFGDDKTSKEVKRSPSDASEVTSYKKRKTASPGSSFGQGDAGSKSPDKTPPGTPIVSRSVDDQDNAEDTEGEDSNTTEEVSSSLTVESHNTNEIPRTPEVAWHDTSNPMEGRPLPPIPCELMPIPPLISPSLQYGTPPESQPFVRVHLQQSNIIPMDEDEWSSDTDLSQSEDHSPFNNLWKLLRLPAHLSVFLHYLLTSDNDPSSLLFYIITDIYKSGAKGEMKKWAYEITSTFLVPDAPLSIDNVDETILSEIDQNLQNNLDKEETLKAVFIKARSKAKDALNRHLLDFRSKRTLGLSNIFIPTDIALDEAIYDKNRELKIIESLLVNELEDLVKEDYDNLPDQKAALASALATVLKHFGVKSPHAVALIEKFPTFVAKERILEKFLKGKKKVVFIKGHHFLAQHYHFVTYCNHCQHTIWGIGDQGFQCTNCEMNIHKSCVKVVEEQCIGSLRNKKEKKKHRNSGIDNSIFKSKKYPSFIGDRSKRPGEDWSLDSGISMLGDGSGDGEKSMNRLDRVRSDEIDHLTSHGDGMDSSKKGNSIGRSESFRQRRETKPSFRKRSDPNIPRSKSDVDVDDKPTNLNNSGSSSNSSLSTRSLDSPSNSLEMVHRTPSNTPADSMSSSVSAVPHVTSSSSTVGQCDDSDLEADTDPPNWQEHVPVEQLKQIKPKEKKRQDVINELFHTEKTHVRNLKVLDRLFYRPTLQESLLSPELLYLLFPNLEELLEIHNSINTKMKNRRRNETVIGDIGEMMLEILDGTSGENLQKAAALFCQNQSIALENLKNRQKKDQKLAQFLQDAEMHPYCRRLQLKDIIATGFQRLTKYPLLLENVAKYSQANSEEHSNLLQAVDCSKRILAHVNQAVKECENQNRLAELQRRLDKSALEKVENLKNLDLTKHKLIQEGQLTWRLSKQKSIEVQVVLLEDIMLLLHKQDEKYVLKFHNTNISSNKEEKLTHSPVLKLKHVFTRDVATDKKAFFLVSTSEQHAIYEFAAASANEKQTWLHHITKALKPHTREEPTKSKEPERVGSTDDTTEETEDRSQEENATDKQAEAGNDTAENSDLGDQSDLSPADGNAELTAEPIGAGEAEISSPQKEVPDGGIVERKGRQELQKVEMFKIADGPQLVNFNEVVVRQGAAVETAQPVLTTIERLRRKDQEIASALSDKQDLVADILHVPREEFDHIAEISDEMEGDKDTLDLLLAAVYQAHKLPCLINEALNVKEEDAISASSVEIFQDEASDATPSPKVSRKASKALSVPVDKLISISKPLNKWLTQLVPRIQEMVEERKQLRKELHNSKEQIHILHEAKRRNSTRSQSSGSHSVNRSRPSSFASVASSASEELLDPSEPQFVTVEDLEMTGPGPTDGTSETVEDSPTETNGTTITKDESCCSHSGEADSSQKEVFVDALSDDVPSDCVCSQTTDLDGERENMKNGVDDDVIPKDACSNEAKKELDQKTEAVDTDEDRSNEEVTPTPETTPSGMFI